MIGSPTKRKLYGLDYRNALVPKLGKSLGGFDVYVEIYAREESRASLIGKVKAHRKDMRMTVL